MLESRLVCGLCFTPHIDMFIKMHINKHGSRCSPTDRHHLCRFGSFNLPTVSPQRSRKERPKVFWQSSAGFGRQERGFQNYYTKISVQLSVQHNKEPEHEARTLHPCLSKQSCSWLSPLSNWWGLRFPIPCYWDLQSHLAGARLVSYIRTYNRSQPPPQTQDYQLQLRLYLRPIHEIL